MVKQSRSDVAKLLDSDRLQEARRKVCNLMLLHEVLEVLDNFLKKNFRIFGDLLPILHLIIYTLDWL